MDALIDYEVSNQGSLFIFTPKSEDAVDHAVDAFPDECIMWGDGYVVEHRYAENILAALVNDEGFTVELDGQVIAEMRPV